MNQSNHYTHQSIWRLKVSWKILVVAYVGLAAASWGILSQGADMSTANGRHLLAGALANLALVAMGIAIAVTAYRQGERWAWFANVIPVFYGIPMISLDSYFEGFWSSAVIPQVLGVMVLIFGLLLPVDLFWQAYKHDNQGVKHVNKNEKQLKIACGMLEAISYLFWIIGLIVALFSVTGYFQGHTWQAIVFIITGTVALLTVKLGLNQSHKCAWAALIMLFLPWTIIGMVDDFKLGYVPLVVGEIFGILVIVTA
jgi:hypothetical protein